MNNVPKVKVGVIGTGALGRFHSRLYSMNPDVEVIGIFDVNTESAQKVADEFGLQVYTDWKELAEKCDALSVAVPATLHAGVTIPLLNMGKHVLVEKPIAANAEEAAAMVEAAGKNNVVFGVGHVERFNQATDYLDQFTSPVRYIEARRFAGYPPARPGMHRRGTEVSVILDLMIHDLDLVLHFIDSEVEKIDVVGVPVLSAGEDIVTARIKFVNGSCANLSASRISTAPERTVTIYQEDRILTMDYGQSHTGTVVTVKDGEISGETVTLPEKNALADELNDFVQAVRRRWAGESDAAAKVTGDHGLKALKLALAIEEEARKYAKTYGIAAKK